MSTLLVCAAEGDDQRVARYVAATERHGVRPLVITSLGELPGDAVSARGVVAVAHNASKLAAEAAPLVGAPWHDLVAVHLTERRLSLLGRLTAAGIPVPKFAAIDAASGEGIERLATLPAPWQVSARLPARLMGRSLQRSSERLTQVEGLTALEALASRWLADPDRQGDGDALTLVVEPVLAGPQWLMVGLLDAGALRVVGIVQRGDATAAPGGEVWLVSPASLSREQQGHLAGLVSRACAAVGLRQGPVLATGYAIDGQACLTNLQAGPFEAPGSDVLALVDPALAPVSLEDLIVRHALGVSLEGYGLVAEERRLMV